MADTSARMLRLLSLLQRHRFWPGDELAERLNVSPRTLRRDVERLRDLGYPVDASRGVSGGYQLRAGAALPPLLLEDEEAVAIALGLRTAVGGAVADIDQTSVQALAKVIQLMPPRLRRRVEALQHYTVSAVWDGTPKIDAMALTVIAQGCRDSERVRFGYTTRDGGTAARLVEPHRLVSLGRRWYLVAWDVDRNDWRTFRVDRLTEPESTRTTFRPRELPGADAAAFVRDRLASIPTRYQAVVVIRTSAEEVRQIVQRWGTVEPLDASSCRLLMNVDSLDWTAFVLAAVGAEFEVIEPVELRDYLRTTSELFAQAAMGASHHG